jgi:hypothetical protein
MPLPGEEEMMAWLLAAADITAQARLRQVQASPLLDGSVFDL